MRFVFLIMLFVAACAVSASGAAWAQDSDLDGLSNALENILGTDPLDPDSDNDFIDDYTETDGGVPTDTDSDGQIDALDTDSDGDGYPDSLEGELDHDADTTPDYRDTDSDDDGVLDRDEIFGDSDFDGVNNRIDVDDDGDGYPTLVEGDNTIDTDRDSDPDYLDTDSDGDTIYDGEEANDDRDSDGANNRVDDDDDGDGIPTRDEGDPRADIDSDGWPNYLDFDADGDGYLDAVEGLVNSDGDLDPDFLDTDSDNDAVLDQNEIDTDSDSDGARNRIDPDDDGDGYPTAVEGDQSLDSDGDATPDYLDLDSDDDAVADQSEVDADSDFDGVHDRIDADDDGDSILTVTEGDETADADFDGTPNYLDTDSDNDGFTDGDPFEGTADDDGDGTPNFLDPDSPADTDSDGIVDVIEVSLGTDPTRIDSDFDGIGDNTETNGGFAVDTDGDGTIDALDVDSDDDTVFDVDEGTADTDLDGVADFRDADDDDDGILTALEGSDDSDGDGTPNHLDLDSDDDGFGDMEEDQIGSDPYDADSTPLNLHDPTLTSVTDVGNDQGRRVRLGWLPSDFDVPGSSEPILSYSVYRRIDAAKAADRTVYERHTKAAGLWDFVMNLPAVGELSYQTLAETLCDSIDAGVCWSVFFVRAHTAVPTAFYDSKPDSGYSVDNLAPAAPTGFDVAYGQANQLTWEPCEDEDFSYFRIYRSSDPGFVPGPATLVHQTAGTQWSEIVGVFDHYRISAVDFAGNESAFSAPASVSGVDLTPVATWSLDQNVPNPFNPSTKICYKLAKTEAVGLVIIDLSGRRVRTLLADEVRDAGEHEAVWNGRDDAGRAVAAGVYFYTLRTGSFSETRRMALIK